MGLYKDVVLPVTASSCLRLKLSILHTKRLSKELAFINSNFKFRFRSLQSSLSVKDYAEICFYKILSCLVVKCGASIFVLRGCSTKAKEVFHKAPTIVKRKHENNFFCSIVKNRIFVVRKSLVVVVVVYLLTNMTN